MAKRATRATATAASTPRAKVLVERFLHHLRFTQGEAWDTAQPHDHFISLALAVRDQIVDRMIATQGAYQERDVKRVYYMSLEYLLGRLLRNNLVCLGLHDDCRAELAKLDLDLEHICEMEPDAGLGNGGLGRLAACYLDSATTLELPFYGYGIRYEYGIFQQDIVNGWQVERPDYWLRLGSPWEIPRPEFACPVRLYGFVEDRTDAQGRFRPTWRNYRMVIGIPFDIPVLAHGTSTVNLLRLWSARASETFDLAAFNRGGYVEAVREQALSETITKVLYPSDETDAGRELRLVQQYFFVACTLSDVLRRYEKNHDNYDALPDKVAVQLNDTHPALAIAELMCLLVDERGLPWERAWELTSATFAYTNHTLLSEALEKWPVPLMGRVLPRHLQIIFEINQRFLNGPVQRRWPGDDQRRARLSLVQDGHVPSIRMAHLAIVGSHHVNGVAALHTDLLRARVVPDFAELWPEKFLNVTNGVTPRRWLAACNPGLAAAITKRIGDGWERDLTKLRALEPYADDPDFQAEFHDVKRANKQALAHWLQKRMGVPISPDALFDAQVKRLHEYKRQLLNLLQVVIRYHRVLDNPKADHVPRVVLFGAKAAPAYTRAKLIIKLMNDVARTINRDKRIGDRLRVLFVPNYGVSLAELIIPAADLSEQISTAGTEASGTGNMKFTLNGALTIGTLDGANIEIRQAVGAENFFLFGLTADEVAEQRPHHDPWATYRDNAEVRRALDGIATGEFNAQESGLFRPVRDWLTRESDFYLSMADISGYVEAQDRVDALWRDPAAWTRAAILNVARVGYFSSDRAVSEYAEKIWHATPTKIEVPVPKPSARRGENLRPALDIGIRGREPHSLAAGYWGVLESPSGRRYLARMNTTRHTSESFCLPGRMFRLSLVLAGLAAAATALAQQPAWPPTQPLPASATAEDATPLPGSISAVQADNGEWRCTFRFRPESPAKRLAVAGTFNGWDRQTNQMTGPNADGTWTADVVLATGVYEYKFLVNDEDWLADPANVDRVPDSFGGNNSLVRLGRLAQMKASEGKVGDGKVDPIGLAHRPPAPLYIQPVGADEVSIRYRTLAHDVKQVSVAVKGGAVTPMRIACESPMFTYWEARLAMPAPEKGRSASVRSVEYTFVLDDGGNKVGDPHTYRYASTAAGLFQTPEWAKHAVWYQIMPDRFRNGDPSNDPEPVRPWTSEWFTPSPWEGQDGQTFYKNFVFERFYGGDIAGLEAKLPYLKELGINAICLNPVFKAPSNHKYDVQNYLHIDDHFGKKGDYDAVAAKEDLVDPKTWQWTESDKRFLTFVKHAHELGFKVILDGVFNHVGNLHPAFLDVQKNGKQSRYGDWFEITSWAPFAYKGWADFPNMPAFRKGANGFASEAVKQHIFNVTRRWMDPDADGHPDDGVDGWRLDVPSDIPRNFWEEWRQFVKQINPNAFITGEAWNRADQYLDGSHFDAVMNYEFAKVAVAWVFNKTQKIKASEAAARLTELQLVYPGVATYALQNLVDSHDTDRLVSMALNPDREYDRQNRVQDNNPNYDNSKPNAECYARARLVALLQMTYVGAPLIYYGDEAGMWGADDPTSRKPMLWKDLEPYEKPDENAVMEDQLKFYQKAIALRNMHAALQTGLFQTLLVDDAADVWAFLRNNESEYVIVVLNASGTPHDVQVPVAEGTPGSWNTIFGDGAAAAVADGKLTVKVPALGGVALVAHK